MYSLSVWKAAGILLLAAFAPALAQDERRVVSPDGQLEFRLFVAPQSDSPLYRIAYQVWSKGERIVNTSLMGLDIWEQEPVLGENDGLTDAKLQTTPEYQELLAKFTQNGSTDRRIQIQIRVYNDGIAFRYIVPRSNMLDRIRIADETTQFAVMDSRRVTIREIPEPGFPLMRLENGAGGTLTARLQQKAGVPRYAFESVTPFSCPWRVILVNRAGEKKILTSLAGR